MARFKWPERLELVGDLPVTTVGKVDKRALRERIAGRLDAERDLQRARGRSGFLLSTDQALA